MKLRQPLKNLGPDGFPAILLLKCAKSLSAPLAIFWNKCMATSYIPPSLKFSIIVPIHKGGSKSDPANYRPVSLTSHLIKVYEKVLRNKLVDFLEANNGLNKNQHGFRSGRSCLTQLLAHFDNVIALLEEGLNVDVVYLDFAKAFDKVDHNILLKKAQKLGIQGPVLKWIQKFLDKRTQSVIVNGRISAPQPVISGVPQGSVLGPLLFLILISDIDKDTRHSMVASFADETRVTKGIKAEEDAVNLQEDLFNIYQWSIQNNMQFNSIKFDLMRYGKDDDLKSSTAYISPEWELIEQKQNVKDLGITMSDDCSFKTHINNIIQSGKNMASWILRTFLTRDQTTMLTLFTSLVRPILEYSSVLWGPIGKGDIQRIEEIQQSFIRKIKGINRQYSQALKDLNLYSLERRRERYQILQVWKMLEGKVPNLNDTPSSSLQIQTSFVSRRGRTIRLPHLATTPTYLQQIKQQTIRCFGAKLFNCLPKYIRNITNSTTEHFKFKLDQFLQTVEDQPILRSGASNSRTYCSNHIYDCFNPLNNLEHTSHGVSNIPHPGEILHRRRTIEELLIS